MDLENLTNIPNPSLKFPWFLWKQVPWILFKDQRSKQGWMSRFRSTQLMAPLAAAIVMEIFTKSLRRCFSPWAPCFSLTHPTESTKRYPFQKETSLTKNIWTHIPPQKKKTVVWPNIFQQTSYPTKTSQKGKNAHSCLVGGFNPLEEYSSNWIISPGIRVKNKIFETTTQKLSHRDPCMVYLPRFTISYH